MVLIYRAKLRRKNERQRTGDWGNIAHIHSVGNGASYQEMRFGIYAHDQARPVYTPCFAATYELLEGRGGNYMRGCVTRHIRDDMRVEM